MKYKTGLALSGGGTRGFAHLGVLKALNKKGIYPDIISGTSAGAITAVLYADGYTPEEILAIFKDKELLKYVEIILPKTGFLKMTGMIKIFKKYIRAKTFEELKMPVYITACNLNTGKVEYFSQGEILKPLVASASIPVLFSPVRMNNNLYVDGGVLENFPVKILKKKAEKIIGVFVTPVSPEESFSGIKSIALRTFHMAINKNYSVKSPQCDILIAPEKVNNYGLLDVSKKEELYKIGYDEATKILKQYSL